MTENNPFTPPKGPVEFGPSITAEDWDFPDGRSEWILDKYGHDPICARSYVLLALIDGEEPGLSNNERNLRLEKATCAILGKNRKKGMDIIDDYDLLLEMAAKVRERIWDGELEPELQPIAKEIVAKLPYGDPRLRGGEDASERRLVRKFAKDQNLYLARVTNENSFDRMDHLIALKQIVCAMKKLGISADEKAIKAHLRPRES